MPHIHSLYIYPVKSLHRCAVQSFRVDPWGPCGDRRWVVTDANGKFLTQRHHPRMATLMVQPVEGGLVISNGRMEDLRITFLSPDAPILNVEVWGDRVQAHDAGEDAAGWLSQALGHGCRLAFMRDPRSARLKDAAGIYPVSFADGFPLLLAATSSLADMNARMNHPVPMERFRPNIVIAGSEPWEEDTWRRIRIGTVELSVAKACSRCKVTTVDQETGEVPEKGEPLRTLAGFRHVADGIMFGQNALVRQEGVIAVGDEVVIVERGSSNLGPPAS